MNAMTSMAQFARRPVVATGESGAERHGLLYAMAIPAFMAILLALVPVLGMGARPLFLLTLVPLVIWTAFTNTERALYVFVAWCWMDGTIRGVLNAGPIGILARDIVLAIVVIGWAFRRLQTRGADPIRWPPGTYIIALFAINGVLQIMNPYSLGLMQSLAGLKVHLTPLPILFLAYDTIRRKNQVYALLWFLTLGTFVIGSVSLIQYMFGRDWTWAHFPGTKDLILQNAHVMSAGAKVDKSALFRPPGTTSTGGFTGAYVGYVFPLAFALTMMSPKAGVTPVWRSVLIGIVFLFVVFIFINSLRAALADAVVGVVICSFRIGGRLWMRTLLVLMMSVTLALMAWTYSKTISGGVVADRYASMLADPVAAVHSDRRTLFDEFDEVVVQAPMGVGLGRAGAAVGHLGAADNSPGFVVFSESHIDFLIFETGIIGAVLLVGTTIMIVFRAFRVFARLRDEDDRIAASSIFSVLLVVVGSLPFICVLGAPPGSILFWLLAGTMLSVYDRAPKSKPKVWSRGIE